MREKDQEFGMLAARLRGNRRGKQTNKKPESQEFKSILPIPHESKLNEEPSKYRPQAPASDKHAGFSRQELVTVSVKRISEF